MNLKSSIYTGHVAHARHRPRSHRLRYRVFSLLLDLDELPNLDADSRLFGYNRAAIFSFRDEDHGDGSRGGLRDWVVRQLEEAGLPAGDLRVRVLCYPRIIGYVFNPLTVYFCYRPDDSLCAALYEVCNTFHERHTYVIPVGEPSGGAIRQRCDKALYVSPFTPMASRYDFRVEPPRERVFVGINQSDDDGPLLAASFAGKYLAFSDRALLKLLLAYPLMTLKVMGAIHVEALRLWLKGVPVHPHSAANMPRATTIVIEQNASQPSHAKARAS